MYGPGQQEPYQPGSQLKRSSMFEYLSQNESRQRHFDDETLSILPETKIISTPPVAMADQNCSPWPPAGPQSWPTTTEIIFIWGALHRRSGPSLTPCLTMGGGPLSQLHRQESTLVRPQRLPANRTPTSERCACSISYISSEVRGAVAFIQMTCLVAR